MTASKLFLAVVLATGVVIPGGRSAEKISVSYNRDIQPLLSENCFSCHGADSASRKAGLRLDHAETATNKLESGATAIVPGHPDKSELVRRIYLTDDDQMPPEKIHKTLALAQKKLLKTWIAAGAPYEPHWSFIAPQKAPLPAVRNSKWVKNPVDNFILARLEQEKLKPNSEADRRTLIRRVTLDLTGLLPTPEEVESFVADQSPDAYEKVVDRLLASPRWGEHRGRYWLDVARYGDTHGIHFDNYREMWTYREWVINAFNKNMPFDEFTIENLAGDLIPNATRDQMTGSGFNRCNITSNEGGLIDEEYLVLYTRDRTETTAQTWLGLTAGCAVCHDHKYDPLSQKEFYSLSAFFNNTTQAAKDGNIKDTPPTIFIPAAKDEFRWQQSSNDLAMIAGKIAERKKTARPDFTNWLAHPDLGQFTNLPAQQRLVFHAPLDEGSGGSIRAEISGTNVAADLGANTNWANGIVAAKAYRFSGKDAPEFSNAGDFERTNAFSCSVWVRLNLNEKNGVLFSRMQDKDTKYRGWDFWMEFGKPMFELIHDWPGNALNVSVKTQITGNDRWHFLTVIYDGTGKAKGVKIYVDGEMQELDVDKNNLTASIRTAAPFKIGQRDTGSQIEGADIQDLRIYNRVLDRTEVAELMELPRFRWLASETAAHRDAKEKDELFALWLPRLDAEYLSLVQTNTGLMDEQKQIRARGTSAYVMNERKEAPEAYVLFRGAYDQRRDRVTPTTPAFLPAMSADLPRNRMGFAKWLLRPENPLTARVTVNRFWQELFGVGLVKTSGDFGVAGEPPSNQELLDWLAVDFRENGWDVKRIFKLMVMSATYRQSAVCSKEKIARDPQNRLLARGPRFRMDAEMVRDSALAASGLLVEQIGGPSTRPYQPPGIWDIVGMPQGDTRKYIQDHGDNLYRRSVYTFWKRQAPPVSMEIFNAPSRETCTVKRERTDTPLQALVTLNDPQFVEAARQLAQESLQQSGDVFDFMAERLLARPLTAKEKKIIQSNANDLLAEYATAPKEADKLLAVGEVKADQKIPPTKLAAYTMVANELMNLDEVLNK
jgi:Protein of unknown function (DUF1553)/Protein of unknown function (DUF1549)/Planctomycete cytochrome C/Concanavalin A-like lectin/glucanases superfamily